VAYLYDKSIVNSRLSVYVANLSFAVNEIRTLKLLVNWLDPRYLKVTEVTKDETNTN
jgi:hypothetical protein